jgi:hypothetical protein
MALLGITSPDRPEFTELELCPGKAIGIFLEHPTNIKAKVEREIKTIFFI